ncbi:MAG: hypothetical protein QM402_09665 [Synergistota bacterium]|jgi:hypothetical protein|nr:hypothetical protein [Synergistota bacterium]
MKKLLLLPFVVGILLFPQVSYALIVNSGLTVEKVVSPSDKTGGVITLRGEESDETVRVYQTDYMFYADGRNEFGKPGSVPRSNASWIAYSPNQITVPAGGRAEVSYQISVPNDKNLRGTYWSVIMVELVPKGALEVPSAKKGEVAVGIRIASRYAVQVITSIGDTGTRALEFADKRLEAKDGKTCLVLYVKNTGERWLVPEVYVDLFGQSGQLGRYPGGKLRIFPGCSVRYTVDLGALKRGKYSAMVIADAGEEKVFGARYTLEVSDAAKPQKQ